MSLSAAPFISRNALTPFFHSGWLRNRFVIQRHKDFPPSLRVLDPNFHGAETYLKLHETLMTHRWGDESDSEFEPDDLTSSDTDDMDVCSEEE